MITARDWQTFHVGLGDSGKRLDVFLCRRLGLSRRQARQKIARGGVQFIQPPSTQCGKGTLLQSGQILSVAPDESAHVIGEPNLALRVLATDDGYLVIDKPAGMPVHPLVATEVGTVLNAVVARYPEVQGVGEGGLRSGIVHRLDVDTSGTLLVATKQDTWIKLRGSFESHQIEKRYRAIAAGRLEAQRREVMDLVVARHRPARVRVVNRSSRSLPAGTRRCDLTWRALQTFHGATLLEIKLGTGFLHQIRVMLAHLGHPVIGDTVYGPAPSGDSVSAPRQMLHASFLGGDGIEATSSDPPDFAAVLDELRGL